MKLKQIQLDYEHEDSKLVEDLKTEQSRLDNANAMSSKELLIDFEESKINLEKAQKESLQLKTELMQIQEANLTSSKLEQDTKAALNDTISKNQQLELELEFQTNELLKLQEQLKCTTSTITEHEMDFLKHALEQSIEENNQLKIDLETVKTEAKNEENKNNLITEQEVKFLKHSLEELLQENNNLKLEIESKTQELLAIQQQHTNTTRSIQESKQTLNEILTENDKLKNEIELKKKEILTIQDEVNISQATISSLQDAKMGIETEYMKLKKEKDLWMEDLKEKEDVIKQYQTNKNENDNTSLLLAQVYIVFYDFI